MNSQNIIGRKGRVLTGLAELDSWTAGVDPGSVNVIVSRPAMGKSTLLLSLVRAAAIRQGVPTALCDVTDDHGSTILKVLSAESSVALHQLRSDNVTQTDLLVMQQTAERTSKAPLHISACTGATVAEIGAIARRVRAKSGLGMLAIDGFEHIRPSWKRDSRVQEIGDTARQLKALAMDLRIPIWITLSVDRDMLISPMEDPRIDTLRHFDALHYAADLLLLLHRADAYEKNSPRQGEADLIITKHRTSPTRTVTVAFDGHHARFIDTPHA